MRSSLFTAENQEVISSDLLALQNSKMLKATVNPHRPVIAAKGSMVAYQGEVTFQHKSAGSVGKFLKKVASSEDNALMIVEGSGDVFFADNAKNVFLLALEEGEGITVNSRNLLAFEATLDHNIERVKGVGMVSGGMFNTTLRGVGQAALTTHGQPVLLDCSSVPTAVDTNAVVAWSSNLKPSIHNSMNVRSSLRGGTGEAFQFVFHGEGFVIVQPSEESTPGEVAATNTGVGAAAIGGGILGGLLS